MPWIRLMLRQRVGPEQARKLLFHVVVTAGAVYEVLFRGRSTSPEKIENEI